MDNLIKESLMKKITYLKRIMKKSKSTKPININNLIEIYYLLS